MVVETLSSLDTYIYAGLTLVVWNFYWTRKQKEKLFGDPKDPTTHGILKEHEELEERVDELEDKLK